MFVLFKRDQLLVYSNEVQHSQHYRSMAWMQYYHSRVLSQLVRSLLSGMKLSKQRLKEDCSEDTTYMFSIFFFVLVITSDGLSCRRQPSVSMHRVVWCLWDSLMYRRSELRQTRWLERSSQSGKISASVSLGRSCIGVKGKLVFMRKKTYVGFSFMGAGLNDLILEKGSRVIDRLISANDIEWMAFWKGIPLVFLLDVICLRASRYRRNGSQRK